MASIDSHLYKCPACSNLSFKKEEVCTISKDKSQFTIREVYFTCIECKHVVKINS